MVKTDGEQTKEELQEELKKIKEELELQKWGTEKTAVSLTHIQKELNLKSKDLQDEGEKFKSIFNGAKDGILIADPESKKFFLGNSAISEMLGYSQEEISSLGIMDIHPEKDIPFVVDQFERQLKGDFSLSRNLPVKRKDGSVFYADVNATPIKIGEKAYLLGFFHDTTERRKIEVDFKKKYDEMERLYNATINRELKMIELKKEIEVLKAKLENK